MPYSNPIIPGSFTDPSICRAGDDSFLATSSFCYVPGVLDFLSQNLSDWAAFDWFEYEEA